jgi:uncharacterized protein (DUF983 family)
MKGKMYSILKGKCPVCHRGDVYVTKNGYDLRNFDKMHERCSHCGHKYEIENGFWYGAMYVSYGLTVAMSVATFLITYWTYPQADAWLYVGLITLVVLGLAPFTFRFSRLVWMNFFAEYDPAKNQDHE